MADGTGAGGDGGGGGWKAGCGGWKACVGVGGWKACAGGGVLCTAGCTLVGWMADALDAALEAGVKTITVPSTVVRKLRKPRTVTVGIAVCSTCASTCWPWATAESKPTVFFVSRRKRETPG